ncbi:MAG: hypothetical protein WCH31_07295 [Actinomycetes bacterium]
MKIFKMKKSVALLVGFAVVAISAVGAFAFFTSTGKGSGTASVGTSTTWAVSTAAATGGPLTPAGPTENVVYHVKNNSTGKQSLANVAVTIANSDGTPWVSVTGCSKDDFSIEGATAGATYNDTRQAANLAADAQADGSITLQMVDTGSNQDGCKNATVPLYLAAS